MLGRVTGLEATITSKVQFKPMRSFVKFSQAEQLFYLPFFHNSSYILILTSPPRDIIISSWFCVCLPADCEFLWGKSHILLSLSPRGPAWAMNRMGIWWKCFELNSSGKRGWVSKIIAMGKSRMTFMRQNLRRKCEGLLLRLWYHFPNIEITCTPNTLQSIYI